MPQIQYKNLLKVQESEYILGYSGNEKKLEITQEFKGLV